MDRGRRTATWWVLRGLVLLAAVVLIFVVLYVWPDSRIVVGPETTYLTDPLDSEGHIDYLAAINQQAAEGVTPENNAAVLYWRALGPQRIQEDRREEFFRQLGIKPLPAEGEYFQSLYAVQGPLDEQEEDALVRYDDDGRDAMELRHERRDARRDTMGYTPWVRDDDPFVAQWLDENRQPIELFIAGTRRPMHFLPKSFRPNESDDDPSAPVLNSSAYGHYYRRMTDTLMRRSMLHSGSGRHREAWQDCLAVFRLVRHAATDRNAVGVLGSYAQNAVAAAGVPTILHEGDFTTDELEKMRQEFRDVAICASIADAIDWGERLMTLDAIHSLSRVRRGLRGGVDWNQVLRDINHSYDLAAAAARREGGESDATSMEEEFEKFENESAWVRAVQPFSRWARSRQVTMLMGQLMLPALTAIMSAERRCESRFKRIEIVFALSLYRAKNGQYPADLSALLPTFLDEMPLDPMNDQPLHYRKQGEGFLVWSVGRNGRDDEGRTPDDWEEADEALRGDTWDDEVYRVPQRLKPK